MASGEFFRYSSLEAFLAYLNSVKTEGTDIDNWTLDELKVEVQNFKKCHFVEEASKVQEDDSTIHNLLNTDTNHEQPNDAKEDAKQEDTSSEVHEEIKEYNECKGDGFVFCAVKSSLAMTW